MKRTLSESVAAEDERDQWAALAASIGDLRGIRHLPAMRCIAVWPMEPLPESCADEIQRIVGDLLNGHVEPCCDRLPLGGIVFPDEPWAVWCPRCYLERKTKGGDLWCDACCRSIEDPSGELFHSVLALAGPYIVEVWLCAECAR